MSKSIGIFAIAIILFSVGLSYHSFSVFKREAAQTEKMVAAQARNIDELAGKIDALKKDSNFFDASGDTPVDPSQDDAETTSFNQRLVTLENEIVAIRTLLEEEIQLRSQMRSNGNVDTFSNAEDETQYGDGKLTQEADDTEREGIRNQLRQLDGLMLTEEPDPQWSGVMMAKLENLFDDVTTSAESEVIINSYDCKSTLCRIEALTKEIDQSHELEDALLDTIDDDAPQTITTRDEQANGDVITTFYLIRNGENLKQMLSVE